MVTERFLDALGLGASDALVDREGMPQVRGGFGRVAVLEVASADSFQRAGRSDGIAGAQLDLAELRHAFSPGIRGRQT